jgi:hypothetical protein
MLSLKHRPCRQEIDLETFNAPSYLLSLIPWNPWMLMTGSRLWRKLQVVQCNNREKLLLASHQLIGPVANWWDAYVKSHEEPDTINWNECKVTFHSHHVPQDIIKLKKKEFQDLKQESMTVSEYVTRFTQLSRYAPINVDTDEKKQECFLNGLEDGLAYALEA